MITDHQMTLIKLRDESGLTWQAIGDRLCISLTSARCQYGHAKRALKMRARYAHIPGLGEEIDETTPPLLQRDI